MRFILKREVQVVVVASNSMFEKPKIYNVNKGLTDAENKGHRDVRF